MTNIPFTLVGNYDNMLKGTDTTTQNYLIKQLPRPTVFLNTKLEVVQVSDSWIEAFGFEGSDVMGVSILSLFPDASKEWLEVLNSCLRGRRGTTGIDRHIDTDKNETWFEWINEPWFDDKENICGIIIQTDDVTQRIKKELEHDKTRILLDTKSEIAGIGSWEFNALHNELSWSAMTKQIHEVPEDYEPSLESAIEFYKEGYSRNTISMIVYKAIETGSSWSEKLQIVTASGKEKWVIAAGKPLYKNGEYIGLIGTIQDVTNISESEIKTRESEKLLRTVVDNLPLNLYIKDLESRKILVNKAECSYMGFTNAEQLLGKSDFDLYDKKIAQLSRDEDLYVMNNGASILGKETISVRKDGSVTHFLTSKIPLYDQHNEVYGLMGISLDISDLKQKEAELRDLINVTSQQNKKLINFAHIVSHNLRSHTANFSMLLDFLVSEEDPKEKNRIIHMLTEASDNLLETLDNLNEVVAINTNVNIEKVSVCLNERVKALEKTLSAYLINHNASIKNEIPEGTRVKVVPAYLDSILMNFLTNAVKYKHPERDPLIRLTARKNKNFLELAIEDNGLGIDLDKYGDKLFGMYKTFHSHKDARGIGLYITKNQIEAMNGKITASSEVGKGTIFKIYFDDKN